MNSHTIEKLEKELLEAVTDHSTSEKQIRVLAHNYRKAVFGPSYENPETVGDSCSFCAKPESEVEQFVAGPSSFICNECIELSYEIIHEQRN